MAGHKTIVEALRAHGPLQDDRERLYRVKVGQETVYVVAKSPRQASFIVAHAIRVTDKDINAALTKAVLEKEEDRAD